MEYYALTDIGKIREKNQDQAATAINLLVRLLQNKHKKIRPRMKMNLFGIIRFLVLFGWHGRT